MKTLIVYFSYTGNNRLLANHLAHITESEISEITEQGRRTWLTMGLDMLFNRRSKIHGIERDVAQYDHVICVAPVWGSKVANPMLTFIVRNKMTIGRYSFISLCGNDGEEQRNKLVGQLERTSGKKPETVVQLNIVDLLPEDKKKDAKAMLDCRATAADLDRYKDSIDKFLHLTTN